MVVVVVLLYLRLSLKVMRMMITFSGFKFLNATYFPQHQCGAPGSVIDVLTETWCVYWREFHFKSLVKSVRRSWG